MTSCRSLTLRLKKQFPDGSDSLVINEFGCAGSRVDVAVINGRLHGYEIKSDCDTLLRLESQVPAFSAVFDRITIVVGSRHVDNLSGCVPPWWGVIEAVCACNGADLKTVRRASERGAGRR